MDRLITQYLKTKTKYDTTDNNRALRQAVVTSDITVMKLLIYTRRADVNSLSPSNKTALDYALTIKDETQKAQVLCLLELAGAKTGQQKMAEESLTQQSARPSALIPS